MIRRLSFGLGWAAAAGVAIGFAWLLAATPSAQQGQGQAPAAAAPSDSGYLLHDSHLHLTNYIQEGPDIRDFLKVMGTKVGRVAIFGLPLQQMWDKNNTGDFAPTYYLQSDAPLYYYSFTDAFIAMAVQVADAGRAGALRSDDHGLQPRGHVRRRPHQARAADVPRRVLRHRRVHDPQGVRLVEDRRQDSQPPRPGPGPHPRLRGRGGPRRHPPQRHRHAVPETGPGAVDRPAVPGPAPAAPERQGHLGARGRRAHRAPGEGPVRHDGARPGRAAG